MNKVEELPENATKQQIFEYVVKFLANQGKQAKGDNSYCLYRSGDLKCAVGCLIPDKYYSEDLEGTNADSVLMSLADEYGEEYPLFNTLDTHKYFLLTLQEYHDSLLTWRNENAFKDSFKQLAAEANLDNTFIDNLVINI